MNTNFRPHPGSSITRVNKSEIYILPSSNKNVLDTPKTKMVAKQTLLAIFCF